VKLTQYVIERQLAAPVGAVYQAFTDAAVFSKWVWGSYGKAVQAEIDLQINGLLRVSDDQGKGRHDLFRGMFLVIEPNRKLIHTLHWDGDVGYNRNGKQPVDEVMVLDFVAEGGGTLLRYRHMGIPDDGVSAPEHERSVRVTLDSLAALLAARTA